MANNQLREELILWTGQFDKKIDDVMKQINKLNRQGRDLGGGFSGSFSSMSGGLKQITSLAKKAGGALALIGVGTNVKEWIDKTLERAEKLSMEAEGVKLAFDRLNKPDLLDNLNRATHNTISNLELMKQAVKFKDFNLNIEQMGTYLAFAQQKAKDTGESIDYLVNSITTGLGRQSLQILDNLGLSAAEIKNEMKKGGDMTTAVANIIKKRMEEAGDYVETAADRAAQREKELNDALVELGNTFILIREPMKDFWHDMEIAAVHALKYLLSFLNEFTAAGRQLNRYNEFGGSGRVDTQVEAYKNAKNPEQYKKTVLAQYDAQIKRREDINRRIQAWRNGDKSEANRRAFDESEKLGAGRGNNAAIRAQAEALRQQRTEFLRRINTPITPPLIPTSGGTGGGGGKDKKDKVYPEGSIGWLDQQISKLKEKVKVSVDITEIRKLNQEIADLTRKRDNLEAGWTPKNISLSDMNLGKMSLTQAPKAISRENNNLPNISAGNIYDFYDSKQASVDAIMKNYDMGLIGKEKAIELINAINTQLESLGLKPLELDVRLKDNTLQNTLSAINGVSNAMDSMGNMFRAVGDESTAAALQIMSSTADMVATVIPQVMALIGVKQGEALASGTASAAKLPFPANIAAIATIVGAIMSVFATIASIAQGGSYANGGVVGGSSFAGDNLIARVNSGEMILNSSQQRNLFHLLDNGGAIGGGGQVEFVLKGQDLYGSMKNYSRIKAMSGINTGIK